MIGYRYSRWDGSQHPFDFDEDDILNALSEDIMNHGDVNRAMRNLLRSGMSGDRGTADNSGMRELSERLRQMQQQKLQQYNLESAMDDIKERLQDVLDTERTGIDRRLVRGSKTSLRTPATSGTLSNPRWTCLRTAPGRTWRSWTSCRTALAGQMRELSEYDFMDPEARQKFEELMDMLRQQMMQNFFQGMKDAIEGMSP